jgi:hypothetical protein
MVAVRSDGAAYGHVMSATAGSDSEGNALWMAGRPGVPMWTDGSGPDPETWVEPGVSRWTLATHPTTSNRRQNTSQRQGEEADETQRKDLCGTGERQALRGSGAGFGRP